MPQRDDAPIGAPCWIDLSSSDPDRSRDFYGALFGWTAEPPNEDFGGYVNFQKDGSRIAGMMRNDGSSGGPDGWSIYLATDDAEKTAAAVAANGGQIVVPPTAVGDLGTMVLLTDAGGAFVGAWQPGTHRGFGVHAETGAPSWFELHTRDYDTSVRFYREAFRWDTHVASDVPEFRYTTFGEEESAEAGIMDAAQFLPDGVPAHWSIYFGVDDTDAALARVAELGGSTVVPAQDSPYGRLASAADPTGALFKLVAG